VANLDAMRYHTWDGAVIVLKPSTIRLLIKAGYGVYRHATVDICHWSAEALEGGQSCYKVKFYGVPAGGSHRCVEMSPVGMLCGNRCVYCWRFTEDFDYVELEPHHFADPDELIRGILEERRRLLSGYMGHPEGRKRVAAALEPTHWAISLSGEPLLYPKLPQLIKAIYKLPSTRSVFLVTHGLFPEMLIRLIEEDALPTQLYLSLNAPDVEHYKAIDVPVAFPPEEAWERTLRSLEILSWIPTRTVLRITLIRRLNADPSLIPRFAELVAIAQPHFVEVKSYMHVGHSTYRLSKSDMMSMDEVREWAKLLVEELGKLGLRYVYMDEENRSRIVVLQSLDRYVDRWIVKPGDDKRASESSDRVDRR